METIGIVTTWFNRGAAFVSKNFLDALKQDYIVEIYARGGEKYEQDDPMWNLPNVTWGKRCHNGVPTYIDWRDFKKWIYLKKPKFILFNEQQSWDIILRLKRSNIIIGAYIDYYTPTTVPFFNLYDFLICNTKRHMSVFGNHRQAFYFPWGTNIDLYKPSNLKKDDQITFFHSCGMSPYRKGTDLVITAFTRIKDPNIKLVIHTQVPLKSFFSDKKQLENKNITVIEKTVIPPGLYQLGDIYLYPSRLDGIGLTIAEALASGLPVITSDNGPMNEFVINEWNGYLIKIDHFHRRSDDYYWDECECNIDDLQRIIENIMIKKREIPMLKQNARKFAENYLDWGKNSRGLLEIFQKINKMPYDKELLLKVASFEYSKYPQILIKYAEEKAENIIRSI
jgi:glycosyltransferase involved in cell wall biosynthesis